MDKIKVALVDEHPIMCDGIQCLLSDATDIQIVHSTRSIAELIPLLFTRACACCDYDFLIPLTPKMLLRFNCCATSTQKPRCWLCRCIGLRISFSKLIKAGAKGHLTSDTNRNETRLKPFIH